MDIADVYSTIARLVPYVPPKLGYAACDLLGLTIGQALPAYQRVRANLQVIMPTASEQERTIAARQVMIGLFKNYFDLFRFHTLTPEEVAQTLIVDGAEHVERALTQGQGLIIVAPHCGNYTVIFTGIFERFKTRVLVVVEQMQNPRIHQLMDRLRQIHGVTIEPLSPTAGRSILRALRRNEIVVLGGDRAIAENATVVNFFGRPMPIPNGPAALALRTGTPLLTSFTNRLPDNRSWVRLDPPLIIQRSDSLQHDICDATQKIAYIMQAYISRDPTQWMVAERVWPTT